MNPTISFLVPCYKLAHFLPECVESILSQSFTDFELLILDDCSPDNTAEVAATFRDPRVRYVRHEKNLGHVGNFNAGIRLSRGKYVWIISADDRFRNDHIAERYVQLMEANPKVGFTFCPAVELSKGIEKGVLAYTVYHDLDTIFPGREFAAKLTITNNIAAPAVLSRRECYERITMYPADFRFGEEWFVWASFALHYDVGYFAEPMVCYRHHETNLTWSFTGANVRAGMDLDLHCRWRLWQACLQAGAPEVAELFFHAIAQTYAELLARDACGQHEAGMTPTQFEDSLRQRSLEAGESARLRDEVDRLLPGTLDQIGNECYRRRDFAGARRCFRRVVQRDPKRLRSMLKLVLLAMGPVGRALWKFIVARKGDASTGGASSSVLPSQELRFQSIAISLASLLGAW